LIALAQAQAEADAQASGTSSLSTGKTGGNVTDNGKAKPQLTGNSETVTVDSKRVRVTTNGTPKGVDVSATDDGEEA
jgi:hypothetical protein